MTREQIAAGLTVIVQVLSQNEGDDVPDGWEPNEWAFIKGIASGEILRLRDRLVPRGTTPPSVGVSETE